MTRWTRHSVFWGLCGVLLVLAGAWLVLLPSRLASSIAATLESSTGLGMAITGSATLAFDDDGPKVRFTKLRLADAKAPGSLKVELAEVLLPLSSSDMLGPPKIPRSARINGCLLYTSDAADE